MFVTRGVTPPDEGVVFDAVSQVHFAEFPPGFIGLFGLTRQCVDTHQ